MSRRKRVQSVKVTLPPELWTEILAKLPVKTLLKFQCVSKLWYSLIHDPHFISTHLVNSKINQEKSHLLVMEPPDMCDSRQLCTIRRREKFRKISWVGLDVTWYEHYEVVDYINGILCLKKFRAETKLSQVFLWNPSIRKSIHLPLPNFSTTPGFRSDIDFAFGFDPIRNEYKVLATLYLMGEIHLPDFIKLFTLNNGGNWRSISIGKGPCSWSKTKSKAFINGVVYWVGIDLMEATPRGRFSHLVAFDVSNEVFNYIELPDCEDINDKEHQRFPVILSQSIALMDLYGTCSYVWVMEELDKTTRSYSWRKKYSIKLELSRRLLHFTRDGELLYSGEREGVMSYNVESKEIRVLAKSYRISPIFTGFYIESLVLFNGVDGRLPSCNFPLKRSETS